MYLPELSLTACTKAWGSNDNDIEIMIDKLVEIEVRGWNIPLTSHPLCQSGLGVTNRGQLALWMPAEHIDKTHPSSKANNTYIQHGCPFLLSLAIVLTP
jgi:hypothetical protein